MGASLLVLGAGCGDGGGEPDPPDGASSEPFSGADDEASGAWLTSTDPAETGGLIWAGGSTVHLADGSQIDVDSLIKGYVVAGDGVFFFPADDADDLGTSGIEEQELSFVGRDGEVSQTGVTLMTGTLRASPDGRYLAGIDAGIGEQDDYGTPVATARVFDLEAGEEVVRSSEGMGDTSEDDLSVVYENVTLDVTALTDDTAYVEGATDDIAYDLATGDATVLPEDQPLPSTPDAYAAVDSPDGGWRIDQSKDLRDTIVAADGRRVVPRTGTERWVLDSWLDDRTAVGFAVPGSAEVPISRARDRAVLMSCVVPSGRCDVVDESAGKSVSFPRGAVIYPADPAPDDPEAQP